MAMQAEALPLISNLALSNNSTIFSPYSIEHYSGVRNNKTIHLLINGKCKTHSVDQIGTQASTLTTHLGIEKFAPEIIINAGTAGGFKSNGSKIGDVYLSYPKVCYHDRRVNLPGFNDYGTGNYPTIDSTTIAKELNLKTGIVSTGDSLDFTTQDLEQIKRNKAVVKEMEAAAIAWVAQQHSIPFLAIKAITDLVDGEHPTEKEFLQNLNEASKNLSNQTVRIIDWLLKNG